jgi:antitoxin component YwqK of YwqJK toxin-antitoxin module
MDLRRIVPLLLGGAALVSCEHVEVVEMRYPSDALYKQHAFAGRALHGAARVQYPDGVVESEGQWDHGVRVGLWTWRHANGALLMQGAFERGLRQGVWTRWREDGALLERGPWVDGGRHGRFELGGSDGAVVADAWWEKGSLVRVEERGR